MEAGAYAVRETKAPNNYIIAETDMQTVNMKADGTSVVEVVFRNYPYGSLLITKVDALTNKPLSNATFQVTTGDGTVVGNSNGMYTTNSDGEILIPNLKPGSYVVTERIAPEGYACDTKPQTIEIVYRWCYIQSAFPEPAYVLSCDFEERRR
ncbi:MAG: collagen binding domain-containing protein [Enterocloster sp.]